MARYKGLWLAIGGGSHAEKVASSIYYNGQFTTTVSVSEARPRNAEVVLVSMAGPEAHYAGISQVGRLVAVDQTTVAVSNLVELGPTKPDQVRKMLPKQFAARFNPPQAGVYRISPRLWDEVLSVLAAKPDTKGKIENLVRIAAQAQHPVRSLAGGLETFERDAIATALQTWGGPSLRKRVLREAIAGSETPTAPFLTRLESVGVREDPQIGHDQITFPGMSFARSSAVGSVVLRGNGEYLTILNCNRQPLERTLGVDLIYYNHRFDSFVLVQYKRMTDGTHGPEYRPDSDRNHAKEMERMAKADKILRALPRRRDKGTDTFRLSNQPFFLKLCEARVKTLLDAGMVSGMYVPLVLWRRLLRSPAVRGPRGGIAVTWENTRRRFNNGEFTGLLRNGWIGSAAGESKLLSKIIKGVLASDHMLVLAATSEGPRTMDYRRDDLGRFAPDDDPAAAI